jgi:hypothetical protein
MQHKKTHLLALALILASTFAVFDLAARTGYGQSASKQKVSEIQKTSEGADAASGLQPTAAVRERRAATPVSKEDSAAIFGAAIARNMQLKYELEWQFGGKQQHGWYLYVPLISRLIETDKDAATNDFASSLSRWQKGAGLQADGILDDETLYRMVSEWQGARLKDKTEPRPDQLLVAPVADFYDPSRPDELRQVERETYAAYKRLVAAALADKSLGLKATAGGELAPEEKFLKIVSSFRSHAYQEHLRQQSPNSGRAGLAVNSPHSTGRALDLYVGGEPVETKDANRALQIQTPIYQWLVRNADRFGFRPYYYEPWHWEYVGNLNAANK